MRRFVLAVLVLLGGIGGLKAQGFSFRWGGYGLFRTVYHPDSGSHFTARTWTMTMDLYITSHIQGFGTMEMLRWNERPLHEEDVLLTSQELGIRYSPIREMWLSFEYLWGHKLRLGQIAIPLGGNEQMQIDFYWPFPRRPMWGTEEMLMLPATLPWSEPGVELVGTFLAGNLMYELGTFQGPRLVWNQPNAHTPWIYNLAAWYGDYLHDNNRDKALAGKIAFRGIPGLELGASGYYAAFTPEEFTEEGRFTAVDVQGKYEKGLIRIIGEFLQTRYNNLDAVLQEFANRYVDIYGPDQPSVVNVAHLFNKAEGFFVDVNLRFPMNPKFFVAGRYEGVSRYGYLHRLVKHPDGTVETHGHDGKETRFTLSLGYRPSFHSELFVSVDSNKYVYLVWGLGF